MARPLQILFLALVLAALGQALWQHQRLPDRIAAHFNGSGQPDGWLSRGQQTAWHIGTVLFLAAVFQGIAALQPRLPKEYVNLPHRDYWLAPERAAATHAWVNGIVLRLGCAVMLFFIALFHLLYRANLTAQPRLDGTVWWLTGGLLAMVATSLVALVRKFGRKPTA
ncbi:MAG TPA: DUF1648 domain-containing protein [Lacunisphaera sp.]|nr:DUF1648 domain-containing protein [Lacunisphaera sp.]